LYRHTHMVYVQSAHFSSNITGLVRLVQVTSSLKSKLLGTALAELSEAGCPSCHPTDNFNAVKDDFAQTNPITNAVGKTAILCTYQRIRAVLRPTVNCNDDSFSNQRIHLLCLNSDPWYTSFRRNEHVRVSLQHQN